MKLGQSIKRLRVNKARQVQSLFENARGWCRLCGVFSAQKQGIIFYIWC